MSSSSSYSSYLLPVTSGRKLGMLAASSMVKNNNNNNHHISTAKNILKAWFGSDLRIGLPIYCFVTTCPLVIAIYKQHQHEKEMKQLKEDAEKHGKQVMLMPTDHQGGRGDAAVSYRKKQISVLLITWMEILTSASTSIGLSCLLNKVASSLSDSASSSSSFLQSWAFQNNYVVNLRSYFFQEALSKLFVPRSISEYFFAPLPQNDQLDHILAETTTPSSSASSSAHHQRLDFTAAFEDHLKRNFIESVARATSVSIGLGLLLIPAVRKILRPPEAVLSEQPHLAAMIMMQNQKQQQDGNENTFASREQSIKKQLDFIEQMTMPDVDGTIFKIKRVWFDEFKILFLSAAVAGLIRRFVTNSATVEFWVGNYSMSVIEKLIDLVIFSGGSGPGVPSAK